MRNIVKASINFLDRNTALRAIISSIDESITDWFYRNSLVFTSKKHGCWGNTDGKEVTNGNLKKPRKKYGRVLRADSDSLDSLLDERFEEATDFILDSVEDFDSDSSD
ncbi:unnamed protein product [[Candida] boidinii]|nr:unnamed protein product [[Candida] boidinii]GMF82484.1 unnamed protein product [[Candida] boidinii]